MKTIKLDFRSYLIVRNITQVMGFQEGKQTYDVIFFLVKKWKYTYVHGLLSKLSMVLYYEQLWDYLAKNVKTSHIAFEVLNLHTPIYKRMMVIEKEYDCETFDGFKSTLICVDKKTKLKKLI